MTPPAPLPILEHKAEIISALRSHPVVVVCGDTGSGKTTQLPQFALEAGFAAKGRRIACTQPRRLAAVTTAERVARELETPIGGLVGWQHRYDRRLGDDTRIKFMTDGVLLAETRGDPLLRKYDLIIIDEAHERSLNVDFLLGIVKRILTRRRDLKVIVSSATLDVARFSEFFDGAPALVIPGRLFPIEVRYQPPPQGEELDLPRDVAAAVAGLPREGDILVFLPGERDIRECAEHLESVRGHSEEIIPLLASLPAGEQARAFRLGPRRRIILATNVAETSVTIPGIRAVVDSGLVRLSRYVHKTQVERLQIEPVSQASARQRAGRCGRLGPGICVRLYSEEDFLSRDAYTPPEILRSSLAGVILTMLDLGLGDISQFPFIEPPRPAMIAEGFRELIELGAVARDREGRPCLSETGRLLAHIPVEPRLARMLLAASEFATLPSAIPVVAAMSCDDPRRRPADEREKAQQQHAQFKVAGSDLLGTLKLWNWWRERSDELSQSKLRKLAKATYLSFPKMREWGDLVRQLARLAERLKLDVENDNGGPDALHRAILSGLLGKIGKYDSETRDYRGARGVRFTLHPSSVLAKAVRRGPRPETPERREREERPAPAFPEWVMAGELVDTTRLFARQVTSVEPAWIEAAAGNLAKHHCHSPEWDGRSGFVRATEQVTLYGLVIVPARRCDYSRHDPVFAREIFIRRGLVDGAFPNPPPPVRQNTAFLDALRRRVEKLRKHELFDEDALLAHFEKAIPAGICSAPALKKWLAHATPRELDDFRLKKDDWWPSDRIDENAFPDAIRVGDVKLRLTYRHDPDDPETDGLTCTVRKSQAGVLRLWRADWLVPGLLPEKLMWMLSVLPTAQRKVLTPLEDTLAGLLSKLKPGAEPLADAVVATIRDEWAFRVSPEAWERARLPNHLRVRFVIRDDGDGRVLAASRDLDEALKTAGVASGGTSVACASPHGGVGEKFTDWVFGDLPIVPAGRQEGWGVRHYAGLHDDGDGVSIRLFAEPEEAARAHDRGVARLFLLQLGPKAVQAFAVRRLSLAAQLYLKDIRYEQDAIARDVLAGAVWAALVDGRPPVRTPGEFARRLAEGRTELVRTQAEIARLVQSALDEAVAVLDRAERETSLSEETVRSLQTQILWLVPPGFPRTTPLASLRHYARYLKGAGVRLERAKLAHASDLSKEARFAPYWQRYRAALADKSKSRPAPETLARFRWLLEEFRISLFAQELKTAEPVSEKRLDHVIAPA